MYSRLGNHGFEVCFIPQLANHTSVGIFLFEGIFSKIHMEPCCMYKMQTHLLLTVKEGGNVILVLGKRQIS